MIIITLLFLLSNMIPQSALDARIQAIHHLPLVLCIGVPHKYAPIGVSPSLKRQPPPTLCTILHHNQTQVAATLILNCLSFCCACNVNLSTAYPNLSFFAFKAFNFTASLIFPTLLVSLLILALPPPPSFKLLARLSSPIRPSNNSDRAIKACSRRESLSMCVSIRLRRVLSSGVRVERRRDWAI